MRELVATPDNPIPQGAVLHELRTLDGRRLRAATFPCPSTVANSRTSQRAMPAVKPT